MRLLFTTSRKVGAALIRWGLDSDCSHFALAFDEKPNGEGLVFHTKFPEAEIRFYGEFIEENKVIHCLMLKESLNWREEERIYYSILKKYSRIKYDKLAFVFWSLWIAWHKITGQKIPSKNKWQRSDQNLCVAAYTALSEVRPDIFRAIQDIEMVGPHQLYKILKENPHIVEESLGDLNHA